jgi:hypothetical protein
LVGEALEGSNAYLRITRKALYHEKNGDLEPLLGVPGSEESTA